MTDVAHAPPGFALRLRKRAFGTPKDTAITVVVLAVLAWMAWVALDWAVLRAG